MLAATYVVRLGSTELVEAGTNAIVWNGGVIGSARLELHCDAPGMLALAEGGRQVTHVQALAAINPADFTHRLRYRWRWAAARTSDPDFSR